MSFEERRDKVREDLHYNSVSSSDWDDAPEPSGLRKKDPNRETIDLVSEDGKRTKRN